MSDNKSRKNASEVSEESKEKSQNVVKDENRLEKMAIEEIYRDIAIKWTRAKEVGPSGWLDCPLRKTNKRFLRQTLRSVISHNKRKVLSGKLKSENKLKELSTSKQPPKFGERKYIFKAPKSKSEKNLKN